MFNRKQLAWLLTIVLLIAGVSVSQNYKDWGLFERFGALITIVGFVSFAFVSESDVGELHEVRRVDTVKKLAERPVANNAENMERWIEIEQVIHKDDRDAIRNIIQIRNKKSEIAIFVIGTLIWAWGSYIPKLF